MIRKAALALVLSGGALLGGAAQAAPPPGASACSGCHGPVSAPVPPIAGRPAADLAAALEAFRAGERPATIMTRLARGFSLPELRAIAAYWAEQAP